MDYSTAAFVMMIAIIAGACVALVAYVAMQPEVECVPGPKYEAMIPGNFPYFEERHHVYNFTTAGDMVIVYYMEECED